MSDLIKNPMLCKNITHLSPLHQTSREMLSCTLLQSHLLYHIMECFAVTCVATRHARHAHNTLLHYRIQLAVLHFNENSNRAQATTKQGEARYDITFPKYEKGATLFIKLLKMPRMVSLDYTTCHCSHCFMKALK